MDHAKPAARPWLALYDAGVPAEALPRHVTVVHSFLSACGREPGKGYIRYRGTALSYADADRLSDDMALELARHGVARGSRLRRGAWDGL